MASLGAEYKWSPEWTFRGGLAYERAPINDGNRDVRLLDGDRVWASLGASYRFNNKLSLDLAYSHVFVRSGTISVRCAPISWRPAVPSPSRYASSCSSARSPFAVPRRPPPRWAIRAAHPP